jgi:hypothetical protein
MISLIQQMRCIEPVPGLNVSQVHRHSGILMIYLLALARHPARHFRGTQALVLKRYTVDSTLELTSKHFIVSYLIARAKSS